MELNNMSNDMKMNLFIEIVLNIFNENIQFPKTKCQPLIPYQTLIQPNKFRNVCKDLLKFYDITVDLTNITPIKIGKKYQKDCKRSKKIANSWINSFLLIKNKLNNNKYGIYKPSIIIDNDYKYIHRIPQIVINNKSNSNPIIIKKEQQPDTYTVSSADSHNNNCNNLGINIQKQLPLHHQNTNNIQSNNNNIISWNPNHINGLSNTPNLPTFIRYQVITFDTHLRPNIQDNGCFMLNNNY
eukprot:203134_1